MKYVMPWAPFAVTVQVRLHVCIRGWVSGWAEGGGGGDGCVCACGWAGMNHLLPWAPLAVQCRWVEKQHSRVGKWLGGGVHVLTNMGVEELWLKASGDEVLHDLGTLRSRCAGVLCHKAKVWLMGMRGVEWGGGVGALV